MIESKEPSQGPRQYGSYLLHPLIFHPRTLILNFSSLYFIPSNSSFLFNPHDFSFTNSSPTFYPTPCNPFQIICYISYPLNSYSSKWDLLFHTFNLIHNISSSSNHSFDFISLIWSCIFKTKLDILPLLFMISSLQLHLYYFILTISSYF